MSDQYQAAAERSALMRAGYVPTPCLGKRPLLPEWQKQIKITEETIEHWRKAHPDWTNTGLLTFKNPVIDIDVWDPNVIAEIEAIVRGYVGDGGLLLKRIGRAPKVAIPFRLIGGPFRKMPTPIFVDPTRDPGPDGKQNHNHVEILADGQQFIACGIHPDTDTSYTWEMCAIQLVPYNDLPPIDENTAREIFGKALAVLRKTGWTELGADKPKQTISERAAAMVRQPIEITDRDMLYGAAALRNAAEEVADTPNGQRNDVLNAKAYTLGRQVAAGRLDRDEVEEALVDAARDNGMVKDDGLRAARSTIASGIKAGMQRPAEPLGDRDGFDDSTDTGTDDKTDQGKSPQPVQWLDMSKWDI
jgi:hypothetical protein